MSEVNHMNFKLEMPGENKTVRERPISPEKMIQWINGKNYPDYVKEILVNKIKTYPPGALRHFNIEQTISEIESRIKDAQEKEKSDSTTDSFKECTDSLSTDVASSSDEDSSG